MLIFYSIYKAFRRFQTVKKTQSIHHEQTELASNMLKQSKLFIIKDFRLTKISPVPISRL